MKNLIFFLPNFNQGGAANSIRNLCLNLNKKKYRIFIVSLGNCTHKREFLANNIKVLELKSHRTLFCFFELNKKLFDYYNLKSNETLFISNINYANVLSVIFVKLFFSYKVMLVERTSLNELGIFIDKKDLIKKKLIKLLMIIFYRFADKVITNSIKTSNDINKLTNCKALAIYPASVSKIKPFKKKVKKKFYNLFTFGRLSFEKNFILLINAMAKIKSKNFKLFILGNGELYYSLKKNIINKKLSKRIQIIKYNKNSNIYYSKADLFINCSFWEGFPNAVIEAINFNIPVLSSQSGGGINEILLNGRGGFLFKNNCLSELTKKLNLFFEKNKLFNNKTLIAKKGLERFTQKKSVYKYDKVFNEIFK